MPIRSSKSFKRSQGFSLLELMLAGSIGLLLSGAMLQALLGDGQNSQRFVRLHAERANQRRVLELVRSDVERALVVSATPAAEISACGWAGRQPVLHLLLADGRSISYSVGVAPSAIWRQQVLMRCGPAFDLYGQLSASSNSQNRVVIDGLARPQKSWTGCAELLPAGVEIQSSFASGFAACLNPGGQQVAMRLFKSFGLGNGRFQNISSVTTASPG
ncbi:prepilin-type N-terminal cleavage/methylation domain-containing protein [Cyanobium sp. WAJ14-Wanaka]|uniref:prepilin-type N-terminal cleavage/methylation domain-containing protein n=1 Tax=Cyanobium sp. WAJ14-Wanaka TaxID=2823725 RepID=UPI0020CB95C5|nr:prepilin-type N-terminal cleavage/methylation domain-containing protein [Cyanobium sp. WAJ14-Wanaka]MCP9774057.1 prepilin-type N-terminal cleavage/methylation domain-containing protein [Cyanobium sp. WAJ14-Wanaka]